MASLVCCLVLGIEGFLFGHDIVTQVRLINSQPSLAVKQRPFLNQQTRVTAD